MNESQFIDALSKHFSKVYYITFVSYRTVISGNISEPPVQLNRNVKVIVLPSLPLPSPFSMITLAHNVVISLYLLITQNLLGSNIIYLRDRHVGVPMLMLMSFIKGPVLLKFGGFVADEVRLRYPFRFLNRLGYLLESLFDTYLLNRADVILVSSKTLERMIRKRIGSIRGKFIICPAGISPKKIEKIRKMEVRERNNEVRIGFIGSLAWWQGVDLLARAVAILKEDVRNAKLLIVGDGQMRRRVEEICLANNVNYIVTGFVPHERALELLRTFDVLVLPSLATNTTEGNIPIKVIEALSFGVPVVVTQHKVFVEMGFRDREHLVYCKPDPYDIAKKTLLVLKDPELRRKLAENGPKIAKCFSYDNIVESLIKSLGSEYFEKPISRK